MVVVAIIAILFIAVAMVAQTSIRRARVGKAQADLNRIGKAVRQLEVDTEQSPFDAPLTTCINASIVNRLLNETTNSGILHNSSLIYNNWNGPYMESIPNDPWGQPYKFSARYSCLNTTRGCEDFVSPTNVRAIFSMGSDKLSNNPSNRIDDVVLVLCH